MKIEKESWLTDEVTTDAYLKVCEDAAKDPAAFEVFKKHPAYGAILEHCTYEFGLAYLRSIRDNQPYLMNDLKAFTNNDTFGGADVHDYSGTMISPSTLRYVKILGDMMDLFGSLDNLSIAEIGCGYGGQCLTIANRFTFKHYTLFDLPQPCMLIDKYLSSHGMQNYSFGSLVESKKYDLVISNYAFSECTIKMQDEYIDKVIKNSQRGYMIINAFSAVNERQNADIIALIRDIHPSLKVERDVISMHDNYILTWGGL